MTPEGDQAKKDSPRRWRGISRDLVLFVAGLLGILHETLLTNGVERPTLLLLFGAMCGLPLFLRADEYKGNGKDDSKDQR